MTRSMTYAEPLLFGQLKELLTEATVQYLSAQIDAGAEAVMLFDTWAGILSPAQLKPWLTAPASVGSAAFYAGEPRPGAATDLSSSQVQGGANPLRELVFETAFQIGTPPRSLVADADDCIMVWPYMADRIQGALRTGCVPHSAPLGSCGSHLCADVDRLR
jgi:hypothetical protein